MPDLVQPVAEVLQNFSTTFLRPQLQPERLSGEGNFPRWVLGDNGPIYGVVLTPFIIPPGLGHSAGGDPYYFETLMAVEAVSLFNGGFQITTARYELHTLSLVLRQNNLGVPSLIYRVLPGVEISFSYLKLILSPAAASA